MKRNNRQCPICGKVYTYCPTCKERHPDWMVLTDTEDCLAVFEALSAYFANVENASKVAEAVKGKDISKYSDVTQKQIKEALGKVKGTAKEKKE